MKWTLEITLQVNVFTKIDRFIKAGERINAIKELRNYRILNNSGDTSLKGCKLWCDNRKVELNQPKIRKEFLCACGSVIIVTVIFLVIFIRLTGGI